MALIKLNNKAVSNATAFGSISSLGSMTFIKKLTASSSATLSFVDGTDGVVLDDTYKEYYFTFKDIHPATDQANFQFNLSIDAGSNYNVTKTSSGFRAFHPENDSYTGLAYWGAGLAQSTNFQSITDGLDNDNDSCGVGTLKLFNPSSSVFVKHYISTCQINEGGSQESMNNFVGGYGNTTSVVNGVRFQMSSGNIDAGDICLYGIA